MLSKKIACLLLSASVLTPAAVAVVETFDSECIEAAENFIQPASISPTSPACCALMYGMPPGDVNSDGKINIADYTLLRRYINADGVNITINERQADINWDGEVNFLDLLALKDLI